MKVTLCDACEEDRPATVTVRVGALDFDLCDEHRVAVVAMMKRPGRESFASGGIVHHFNVPPRGRRLVGERGPEFYGHRSGPDFINLKDAN